MTSTDPRTGAVPSLRKGPLPPTFFLGALLLQIGLHVAWPIAHVVPQPWSYSGGVLLLAGLLLNVLADRQFKRARTAINPFRTASVLVTDGVFRYSRNPMYLGMVTALLGIALMLGTLTSLLIPALFAAMMQVRFIRHEEHVLIERFGQRYLTYAERTRRWL